MPAILLNSETFTRGFGEGTEDAKAVAQYIDDVRKDLQPLYDFFVRIVQYRATVAGVFRGAENDIPEYKNVTAIGIQLMGGEFRLCLAVIPERAGKRKGQSR